MVYTGRNKASIDMYFYVHVLQFNFIHGSKFYFSLLLCMIVMNDNKFERNEN